MLLSFALLSAFGIISTAHGQGEICRASCSVDQTTGAERCKFTAKINVHSSELGYFQFEECGDSIMPTLGMEVGKTYEFIQADSTNHYHPLGFAYFPDGAHADVDELEPGIVPPGSSSTCDTTMSCPAPMYYVDDRYLGTYSNNADLLAVTENQDNFGLDDYEPKFFHPIPEWAGYGTFHVFLKFDADTDYNKDIFYFCHIHELMTGRIKLLRNDEPIQEEDMPEIDYDYENPTGHDAVCGTYGLNDFQLPHDECPQQFVCDVPEGNSGLAQFSQCIDSMNCAMMAGMTTTVKTAESEVALFIHQMIPHHQNAVNMAKALLVTNKLQCEDITDDENPDCAMEVILREIINNQNAQIQTMRSILEANNYPQEDDCKVMIREAEQVEDDNTPANSCSIVQATSAVLTAGVTLVFFLM